ncbi:PfkB family carbohydrate kinase [Solirubrobacter ginsenosidimutans]|uniref:Ribokinase n=1 Tax=Solirubrobacter ginsenosidimutans TaxID=490573 RepID=A0A9X3MTR7_9ACTN|nr:PfkB family carbohydrate kinase [Solirubrobacter ginsenosidimutans]MDA0162355.1 PfkB family carbohydrate kinase [Solirubrobacter ginsenosidimutans]
MPSPRVVVVGSINVDLVVAVSRLPVAGETVAGGVFGRYGGGKSANQAVAAARLGALVSFVGAVGSDEMGAEAVAELASEGIDVSCVARVGAPTGVALIVVDASGENQIAVASGANAALDPAHVTTALKTLLAPAATLSTSAAASPAPGLSTASPSAAAVSPSAAAVSPSAAAVSPPAPAASPSASPPAGVVLLGHEVSEAVVSAAAGAAADAGWPVVLNPAPARELPDVAIAVLTPNASEAAELTGRDDPSDAARALASKSGAAVLITLGGEGALLFEPGGEPLRLPASKVDVVDTTGAGDTVNGALAAELAAGRPLPDAATFALRAAALSTTAEGARGGMPTRAAVEATT